MNTKRIQTTLKLLFAMLVWGGTFTSAKILGQELEPEISAFLRFLIASVVLSGFLIYKEKSLPKLTKKQFFPLLGMGLTGIALYNLFFFYGLVHAEAGRGSMITATNPIITAFGAVLLFRERFTLLRGLGFVICLIGVGLIITRGNIQSLFDQGVGTGELAFIGAAFSWSAYTLLGRFVSDELSSLVVITYASGIGTFILFFIAMNAGLVDAIINLSMHALLNLLYLSILATVIGFVWFQDGVKVLGAANAAVFIYFMPVSAVLWAHLILGESVTVVLVLGAFLVILGIHLVNREK